MSLAVIAADDGAERAGPIYQGGGDFKSLRIRSSRITVGGR